VYLTRRQTLPLLPAGAFASPAAAAAWTPEWDRAVIEAALAAQDPNFDPEESMLVRHVGSAYNYHSALRNTRAHPTRESLEYALLLLEAGSAARAERAAKIIDRVIAIQETDPASRFYGLWGYYLEEPAPKMAPADFNWADFNGALLLLIEFRHRAKLPEALRRRVRESIRHAAYSVKRRNVTMTYTNIAVKGTFVTLAAGQVLGDKELWDYATDRQRRFARTVDETGSFAEYNSPTYANVTIANLTRIRMFVQDPAVQALNEKIHERIWLHLGRRWHLPTRQLAGPMSRCYSTDIGLPLWLQKALAGRLQFATLEDIRAGRAGSGGEVGVLDYQCPESIAPLFLTDRPPRQVRELFTPLVQGTTWLDTSYSLGSVNRGNFWIQQRALLAYWGGPARPARYAHLRFMHDDYDFASALLYATGERNRILGLVNFRSPGGDKHVSIDMIPNGEFLASSLRLRLDVSDPQASVRLTGDRLAVIERPGIRLTFHLREGAFGKRQPAMRIGEEDGRPAVIVDLLKSEQPVRVRWADIAPAYLVFTLAINAGEDTAPFESRREDGRITLRWGDLEMTGAINVAPIEAQHAAFSESRRGRPVPATRLSDEPLI
jgi:hypothetical protein